MSRSCADTTGGARGLAWLRVDSRGWRGAAYAALLAAACTTDTANLERRPTAPSAGTTTSTSAADAGELDGSTSEAPQDETAPSVSPVPPPVDDEPQGQWALTLLHAVVDAERLAFCLLEVDPQGEARVYPDPLPGPRGLRFGQALVLERPEGLNLAEYELQLLAVRFEGQAGAGACEQWLEDEEGLAPAGSSTEWSWELVGPGVSEPIAGPTEAGVDAGTADGGGTLDAAAPADGAAGAARDGGGGGDAAGAELDAGADADAGAESRVQLRRLVRWPAGALSGEYSYLLAASGCFTGYGPLDERVAACGEAVARQGSSITGRFVRLSRKRRFDSLSLQVFNASAAHPQVGLRSIPQEQGDGLYFVLADGVAFGQALPLSAVRGVGARDLGSQLERGTVEVYGASGQVWERFSWGAIFEQSPAVSLRDAQPLALTFLGAPRGAAPAWANRAAAVLLFSDPRRALAQGP